MLDENGKVISDLELIKKGIEHLDDAVCFFMESTGEYSLECEALMHFTHAAFNYGKAVLNGETEKLHIMKDYDYE